MGDGGGLRWPRQPWSWRPGARGELAGSMERERCGLGKVEESAGVLTFEGIGSRWPGGGDQRRCLRLCSWSRERNWERLRAGGAARLDELGGGGALRGLVHL